MNVQEKFDVWALIELFGHQKMAGRVTEITFGGSTFLQVQVPETAKNPEFTRLLNPSAIYAINPLDEESARNYAERLDVAPIKSWDVKEFMDKAARQKALLSSSVGASEHNDEEEEEEEEEDED